MKQTLQYRHVLVALAVFVADQLSKGVIDKLPDDFSYTVVPGVFRIIHAENPGVAFGLFQTAAPWFRDALISASSLALVVVLALLWKSKQTPRTGYAMALIVGGACGNLFDRILHGRVVDFLLFYLGAHSWPVFNLADSAIVVGAGLLVWEILHEHPAAGPAAAGNEALPGPAGALGGPQPAGQQAGGSAQPSQAPRQ